MSTVYWSVRFTVERDGQVSEPSQVQYRIRASTPAKERKVVLDMVRKELEPYYPTAKLTFMAMRDADPFD